MPKYILHGGNTKEPCLANDDFFKLMAKEANTHGRILMCYFSRESVEEQRETLLRDTKALQRFTNIEPEEALEEIFVEQMQKHNVIYIAGGSTELLMKRLKNIFGDDTSWLTKPSKTYFGSSAGSYIMARDFFSQHTGLHKGFGIIPYGIIAHHEADGWTEYQDTTIRQKPLLMLHETQFVVIETADASVTHNSQLTTHN
ncbi:MAG: hypothetical protein COY40_01895 [Alphaproteobacteria bacterium CG_4_10_14_0_8_um_filter_53_9]|nr:MAG: hypothetical protein COY40_01895 [Alphaproteobacteria bacterium CG_4_10_14_0_8_um_filter_53_9]